VEGDAAHLDAIHELLPAPARRRACQKKLHVVAAALQKRGMAHCGPLAWAIANSRLGQ
jgi:hypothetical protein